MKDIPQDQQVTRLGAPEHLDRALYVTTPKGWLALLTLLTVLAAVAAWALLGEVSTYVEAEGLIIRRGGAIVDVTAPASGTLARILPQPGAAVAQGDPVAELVDAEILERHASAQTLQREWAAALQQRTAEARREGVLLDRNLAARRARLDELERSGRELLETTQTRLDKDRALLARGVANQTRVERGEHALDEAQRNLTDTLRRRDEMEAADLRRRHTLAARVSEARTEHAEAQRQVNALSAVIQSWRVLAPAAGRVTELKAQVGARLTPGAPLLSLETGAPDLEALFFAPPAEGKRITAGMTALVTLASAPRAEFGYLLGEVEQRSEFPVSLDGMMATLRNEQLAQAFSHHGAPYQGRIRLLPDPATASGYAWTSSHAAPLQLTPGALARVEVRVASRRPAALLMPWLKEKLDF